MKRVVLLITLIALVACKNEPVDYAVIKGKLSNVDNVLLTINSLDRSYIDTLTVAEDGTFSDTLRIDPDHYILYDEKNFTKIYINHGDNLEVNYDANDFSNTLTYTGVGSEVNNYLTTKRNTESTLKKGEGTSIYTLEEDAYKAKFSDIKDSLVSILNASNGISDAYKTLELKNLNYSYLNKLSIYKVYHSHYAKKPDFETSEGFLNELDSLDYLNAEDFKFSDDYRNLVTSHYRKVAGDKVKADSTLASDITYLKEVATIQVPEIKNRLLYDAAKYGITYTEDLIKYYDTYINSSTNEAYNKEVTDVFNKLKAVAKGQPSPKFVNYENYNGETTSLDDLKGKYVYIDVWATWCGPCKKEIPFLKDVEKQYHDKNIEFVSISIDRSKDHDKWKAMVEEKELGGIQLFADNDWNSDFVKDYQIKGIPRFILIDPDGNIVNSNAPRPSDKKLITLFDKLSI